MIAVLDKHTIDRIAAGEVVERPASVVKELLENSLDSGADSISVEIKDGGETLIRVTDNGCGIPKDEVKTAFLRHSTSKIRSAEDLHNIFTLGFRGEALSSISAVSRVEIITKTEGDLTGIRYSLDGGFENLYEEVGAPEGTTIIVKDIFYNTPARRKFLKSSNTEAAYIGDLIEKLALSHPHISFRFINKGSGRLQTSGKGNLKDTIYQIYGKQTASALIPVDYEKEGIHIKGFLGKPEIAKGSRSMENYFVNGRYVKDKTLCRAIEDGYSDRLMQHKYPFTVLYIEIDPSCVDVNVHPSKMEVRFSDSSQVYRALRFAIEYAFTESEMISTESFGPKTEKKSADNPENALKTSIPEPFEKERTKILEEFHADKLVESAFLPASSAILKDEEKYEDDIFAAKSIKQNDKTYTPHIESPPQTEYKSQAFDAKNIGQLNFLAEESRKNHTIVGQIFGTYWIVEFQQKMYIIDQHAAHEKVLYEKFLKAFQEERISSQMTSPPILLTLSEIEADTLKQNEELFKSLGFEIEHFGGKQYTVYAIPSLLPSLSKEDMLKELIANLTEGELAKTPQLITEKTASMACKAAVKGNQKLSLREVEKLIDDLLLLDNPYNCPHGRPTIIEMSRYELEKKFKRII